MIEVEVSNLFSSQHLASTCPICQAAIAAELGGSDDAFDAAPAQVGSNVTGVASIGASTSSYIEAIRRGVKWDLSAGETLSYSYYTGDCAHGCSGPVWRPWALTLPVGLLSGLASIPHALCLPADDLGDWVWLDALWPISGRTLLGWNGRDHWFWTLADPASLAVGW